jgi:aquaporin Z
LFVGGWALAQLWLFWVAPLAGAVIGGFAYKWLGGEVKVAAPRAAE